MSYDPDFAARLRAASAAMGDRPEQALMLANSDLTEGDMALVGGFTQALETSQLVKLARASGVRTYLNSDERAQLDTLNEPYADVDDSRAEEADPRNWLERIFDGGAEFLANTGGFLADLPGVSQTLDALDWLNDVAHLPWRLISSGVNPDNDDEVDAAMAAHGYDGGIWDSLAFYINQGDQLYHDLDGIRETYGDRMVDLAIQQQYDPEKFAEDSLKFDEETQKLLASPEFAEAADLVDRQHISPGRDIARALTFGNTDSGAFTAISGTFDAAYTILLDPTLMAGKVAKGVRALDAAGNEIRTASRLDRLTGVAAATRAAGRTAIGARFRSGIRDAYDQDGIRALLAVDDNGQAVTRVGAGVQSFLNKVKAFDEATDEGERAAIFARAQAEHRDLMPLWDEVRGKRVLPPKAQEAWRVADEVDEVNAQLAADLANDKAVQDALAGVPSVDETEAFDLSLRIAGRRQGKMSKADKDVAQVMARRSALRLAEMRFGRKVEIDERLITDTSRGATARFTAAAREAFAATRKPMIVTQADEAVPVITDAGPAFEHKLIDVNGQGHLATQGDPIYDLKEFADYFASTAGLLRLAGGAAAKRELLLPGRVALRQRLAGWNAARRQTGAAARRNAEVYDHSNPYRLLPHEAEENLQRALDDVENALERGEIDAAEARRRGDLIYQEIRGQAGFIRKQRAKWEQRARRISSLLPTVQAIDLTSADSIEQVRRFARLYMNKTEADRLTALYAAGDLGQRRGVVNGIVEQTLHASGLSRSETGLKEIERFRLDQEALDKRAYGLSRTDIVQTDSGPRHVALLPSQLSEKVLIPDFRSLQYLATKHAVGGIFTRAGHLRSIGTSEAMDAVIGAIKMGWITTPAGGLRNALDEVANVVLKGDGASLLRGRAAFSEAIRRGREASAAERRRAASLVARIGFSIPRALRGLPRTINDVVLARGLGKVMMFSQHPVDDLTVKHVEELRALQEAEITDEVVTGSFHVDDLVQRGNDEALAMHRSGLAARQVTHNGAKVKYEFQGWSEIPVDDGSGFSALSNSLGMAFQDLTSPAHVALRAITTGGDAIGDIVAYMHQPVMRHFLRNAEAFKWTPRGKRVTTPEQLDEAINQYAVNLAAHVTMLVSGRGRQIAEADEVAGAAARYEFDITQPGWWDDPEKAVGPINPELAEMLQRGEIPDAVWLKENLADDELPSHAIGKRYAPVNPAHIGQSLAQGYTAMLAKGYDFMVTRQIRAISRNPMMAAAYDQARRNLAKYEQHLIDNGFTEEAAAEVAQRAALRQAEALVIKSIDDPTLSTQYAMLARNFHAFARAQEDWLRRWGRTIRDDPTVIRRAQLAIQGGESAGLLERDDQGNLIFTYPGSGELINLLGKLTSKIPGMPDMAKIPVVPDLTSRLIFLNPSLDNPVGFSGTPLVSIPFDVLAAVTGSDHTLLMSSMDRVVNGELGAGRTWLEKLLPGWVNRLYAAVPDEDMGSQYGSAFASALANLEAAGRLDELDGSDPSAIANFQNDLKAQIANQMAMRALLGFVLPASPSLPTNDTTDVETGERILEPDYVWEKAGLATLKDEARKVFGSLPYEEAMVWWQTHHPGELVYQPTGATSQTIVGDSEAQAPATVAAQLWLERNPYLVEKYGMKGGIANYFIPNGEVGTPGGEFSQDAYRAQLELGIREYKTLDQFFEDIVVQRGEATYYNTKDDYDEAIAAATAAGNTYQANRLQDEWAQVKQTIKWSNPLMAAKFAEYATSGIARERTINQLNELLADRQAVEAIGADQAGGVAELLLAQREYEAARQAVAYERGFYATTRREEAKANFEAVIADVVARFPGLADLARGAFRVPD